jgi:site-specific recombinase XerC
VKAKRGRKPKAGRLSDGSIRHNLNLLSRFFSWAVIREHVAANPVRSIPTNHRPQQAPKRDVPYLKDNRIARKLLGALPSPVNLMFYVGHTSGLRLGEICGLRMSDMAKLSAADDATIRVRYSYDGPLKEDKKEIGLSKLAPVGGDAERLLRPWINRRLAEGAQPEDYLFNNPNGGHYLPVFVERTWRKAALPLKVTLTFYEATRHSFASRLLVLLRVGRPGSFGVLPREHRAA